MAQDRNVYVKRKRKKPSAIIPALLITLAALLAAAVGAYAWQGISGDTAKLEDKMQMISTAQLAQGRTGADSNTRDLSGASSQTESDLSSEVSSLSASEQSVSGVSGGETSSQASTAESSSSGVVPEGVRVKSTYFDDALFVGDSITDGIRSYELMQNATVISHTGINPDSIRNKAVYRDADGNLITMLEAMAQHPDVTKIYVMLGANSASWMDHDLFIEYYTEFMQSVQKQHPDAIIYLQSITPINEAKFKTHYTGQELTNEKIHALNQDLIGIAQELGVYYVDVAEALTDDAGQLPDEATSDGLHFSTNYYTKWFDYLKTHTIG